MAVRTMKGKLIDMHAMASANATARAVGNASMNARGDRIDARGNVVMTREAIDASYEAYYRENPMAVRNATLTALEAEALSPAQALNRAHAVDTRTGPATPQAMQVPQTPPAPVLTVPATPVAPSPAPKSKKVLSDE